MRVRARAHVCVCVRARASVCVCVCARARARARARVCGANCLRIVPIQMFRGTPPASLRGQLSLPRALLGGILFPCFARRPCDCGECGRGCVLGEVKASLGICA